MIRLIDCHPRPSNIVGSPSDTVMTHAVRVGNERTRCGRRVDSYRWRNVRDGGSADVECQRCVRSIVAEREKGGTK